MSDDITEFEWLNPLELHLVGMPANRFDEPLLAKAAEERALGELEYLFLCKSKYSDADLRRLKAEGHTLPGTTSYPIDDDDDLRRAIRAVGRGRKASHDAIRRYVIRRAKEMGKSDLIPENWAGDGSLKKGTTMGKKKELAKAMGIDLSGGASTARDQQSGADLAAMIRRAGGQTREIHAQVLKMYDDRVTEAQAAKAAAGDNEFAQMRAHAELRAAQRARLMFKMVLSENGGTNRSRLGPNSRDLFNGSTLSLPDDRHVHGWTA